MHALFRKIAKVLAYLAAAIVILLAIAVGLFRLMLPRIPEYQEEIKAWADAAIGMQVEFAGMNARWRLSGPELIFHDARLTPVDAERSLFEADEVSVSVSLMRLLRDRQLVVDRIFLSGSALSVQRSKHQGWLLQGMPVLDIIESRQMSTEQGGDVVIVIEDVDIEYLMPDASVSAFLNLEQLDIERRDDGLFIESELELEQRLGERLSISAEQLDGDLRNGIWDVAVEGKAINIAGIVALDEMRFPSFTSGVADFSAAMKASSGGIDRATANFILRDVAGAAALAPFDAQGRVEYSRDDSGWLLAASNFSLRTVDAEWPETMLSVRRSGGAGSASSTLSVSASFLNLDDYRYVAEWIPVAQRERIEAFDPSGVMRDVRVTLRDLQEDVPQFDVSTRLEDAGIAATDNLPGFRRISGLIRTDNAGGRVELDSTDLALDLPSQFNQPLSFDDARGTVIWRRNQLGVTVLSDSIRLRNADLDSNSSLQVFTPADGSSPDVDLQSTWSVNDVSAVRRYLPVKLIKPKLYQWLNQALVAGHAPSGTLQLTGRLEDFPFDNGEGVFRATGHLEDTVLRYHPDWPDVQNMTLDVVVEGMRLYSLRNSAVNAGNSVKDARIEIPDLRKPILYIDAFSTGSLQSIMDFSQSSPIASLFGGHLNRVAVAGEASFHLELEYPILDKDSYDFSTRIQASNGELQFAGFGPALSELNGIVNISREEVSSESLFGTFLGESVDIELYSTADADSPYSVIAEIDGRLTDAGLVEQLAPAMEPFFVGTTAYSAELRFPRAGQDTPVPFSIGLTSSLVGFAAQFPQPIGKMASMRLPIDAEISFVESGRIETNGTLGDDVAWLLQFVSDEPDSWDLDRGMLTVGGDAPELPETRGIHVMGNAETVIVDEWLALARNNPDGGSMSERIRFIELQVGRLNVIGQDLFAHRVRLDRSSEDWLVSISGDMAIGSVTVPYDFAAGRPLVVNMERLILPGADEAFVVRGGEPAIVDPRRVPPISVAATEFGLGERLFGELQAEFAVTANGLESTLLETRDETFTIQGAAGWVFDEQAAERQRTFLNAKLVSTDIRSTMERLNYQPGIEGEDLEIDLDVGWAGGPGADFLGRLDGTVGIRLGAGQLDDVEPGAGRVFGLMSIVALPRRLSLDFSDVFEKGYGFDRITGSFRINQGDAYTCNLSLEGPAADVGIVGRTGLASRDYQQTAVISANVGNTLPIVGAVVAGPQVAAALLIFSQIFKKPLQEVGQVYYGIDGSWDEPQIASSNIAGFTETSAAAGCIEEARQ